MAKEWTVTFKVTTNDEPTAEDLAGYFDDALAEQGERVAEDNGYDWDATEGFISDAYVVPDND
jgi:hypothetical protein